MFLNTLTIAACLAASLTLIFFDQRRDICRHPPVIAALLVGGFLAFAVEAFKSNQPVSYATAAIVILFASLIIQTRGKIIFMLPHGSFKNAKTR